MQTNSNNNSLCPLEEAFGCLSLRNMEYTRCSEERLQEATSISTTTLTDVSSQQDNPCMKAVQLKAPYLPSQSELDCTMYQLDQKGKKQLVVGLCPRTFKPIYIFRKHDFEMRVTEKEMCMLLDENHEAFGIIKNHIEGCGRSDVESFIGLSPHVTVVLKYVETKPKMVLKKSYESDESGFQIGFSSWYAIVLLKPCLVARTCCVKRCGTALPLFLQMFFDMFHEKDTNGVLLKANVAEAEFFFHDHYQAILRKLMVRFADIHQLAVLTELCTFQKDYVLDMFINITMFKQEVTNPDTNLDMTALL